MNTFYNKNSYSHALPPLPPTSFMDPFSEGGEGLLQSTLKSCNFCPNIGVHLTDHVEQATVKIPLGSLFSISSMGCGSIWILLGNGKERVWNMKEGSLSDHCIDEVKAKRQEFTKNLLASDRFRILGDDAMLVIFKVEHN